jgi:hypothetical protein
MKLLTEFGQSIMGVPFLTSLSTRSKVLLVLLFQQVIIFLPVLNQNFVPHRLGDDFVIANSGLMSRYDLDFLPNSISEWFNRIRGRYYLTETMRLIVFGFNANYRLLALFFCLLWVLALVALLYSIPDKVNNQLKLIFILLVGAAPYRYEFMLLPQGDGYILVFLFMSMSILFLKSSFSNIYWKRITARLCSLLLFYLSLYLYELGTLISIGFVLGIYLIRRISSIKFKDDHIWASSYPVITIFHSLIIVTSPAPIWNRSSLSNLGFFELIEYSLIFSKNYLISLFRPFGSIIRNDHEILRFSNVLFHYELLTFFFCAFALVTIYLVKGKSLINHQAKYTNAKKQEEHVWVGYQLDKAGKVLLIGIFLVLIVSPYIGFLTFSGGFPSRLLLFPTVGFAAVVPILLMCVNRTKHISRIISEYSVFALVLFFTLFSSYFMQSLNSVSKYDKYLTHEITQTLKLLNGKIEYPVLINLPVPACQEVGFWRWNPSIWESNQGNLTIAESLKKLNGQQNELNQIFYVPRAVPLDGTLISADPDQISACSIAQDSSNYFGYHSQEVEFDSSVDIPYQFAFTKNLEMYQIKDE